VRGELGDGDGHDAHGGGGSHDILLLTGRVGSGGPAGEGRRCGGKAEETATEGRGVVSVGLSLGGGAAGVGGGSKKLGFGGGHHLLGASIVFSRSAGKESGSGIVRGSGNGAEAVRRGAVGRALEDGGADGRRGSTGTDAGAGTTRGESGQREAGRSLTEHSLLGGLGGRDGCGLGRGKGRGEGSALATDGGRRDGRRTTTFGAGASAGRGTEQRAGEAGVVLRAMLKDPIGRKGGHGDQVGDERSGQRAGVEVFGGAAEGWGQRVARLRGEG
jgi:hypothetical protein